jgi:hypothetical protein
MAPCRCSVTGAAGVQQSKRFFFEKKNQKTFVPGAAGQPSKMAVCGLSALAVT